MLFFLIFSSLLKFWFSAGWQSFSSVCFGFSCQLPIAGLLLVALSVWGGWQWVRFQQRSRRTLSQLQQKIVQLQHLNQSHQVREAELSRRSETLQGLLLAIPDLILRFSADGICLDFIPAKDFEMLLAGENWCGKSLFEMLPLEMAQKRMQAIDMALQTRTVKIYVQQFQMTERVQYEEVRVVPLMNQEVLVMVRDITDRRRAEQAVEERDERLQTINKLVPGTIYQYESNLQTRSSKFSYLSSRAIELFELDETTLRDQPEALWDLIHPEDLPRLQQAIAQMAHSPAPWWDEFRVITPSGLEKWIRGQSEPLLDPQQQLVYHNGIFTDITDRKRTEAALAEREAQYRRLVEDANDLIFALSQDSLFTYLSPRFPDFFGYAPAEFMGKSLTSLLHPDDVPLCLAFIQEVLRSGKKQSGIEFQAKHRSGYYRWMAASVSAIKSADGAIVGVQGICRDIDDYKRVETQLQQQAVDLAQTIRELRETQAQLIHSEKMSSLGQLVAGVAHEINNPINFIAGNLTHAKAYTEDLVHLIQLYQQIYPQPDRRIETIMEAIDLEFVLVDLPHLFGSMQAGTDRIHQIVASLRSFSRIDEADYKSVDLHEGIESALMLLQSRFKARPTRPEIAIVRRYGDLPLVSCYARQINQVFMHLLTNAIDAIDESNQFLPLSIPASANALQLIPTLYIQTDVLSPSRVRVRIVDNGIGIPNEIQKHIFDPFFTTKPVGSGTGLGLSTSYQIVVQKHRGSLRCLSSPNEGAEFIVELPIE